MGTKSPTRERNRQLLEYVLEDFLELKAPPLQEKTKALKDLLFSHSAGSGELSLAEGFFFSKHLVVIEPCSSVPVTRVVFVRSGDGHLRLRELAA